MLRVGVARAEGLVVRVGLITYDNAHRKTADVLHFLDVGAAHYEAFALPFVDRAARSPLYPHRPDSGDAPHTRESCGKAGVPWHRVGSEEEIPDTFDRYLVLGCGILRSLCSRHVLNAHGGIIPLVRGLDSLKWAILSGHPVGVTLHRIDAEADMGEVIGWRPTPISSSDTFTSFARRHYMNEILTLSGRVPVLPPLKNLPAGPAHKRMGKDKEVFLMDAMKEMQSRRAHPFRLLGGCIMAVRETGTPDTFDHEGLAHGYVSLCGLRSSEKRLTHEYDGAAVDCAECLALR